MAWAFLLLAITCEVAATLALRASNGLTRVAPSVLVVVGYGLAFVLLAQALRHLRVGAVYATWSGLGTVGATLGGAALFGERLTAWAIVGIVLVVAGVAVLDLAGTSSRG